MSYSLERELGSGNYGRVYQAHHKLTEKRVAIKRFCLDSTGEYPPQNPLLSLRELDIMARVNHPLVMKCQEVATDLPYQPIPDFIDDRYSLIMEQGISSVAEFLKEGSISQRKDLLWQMVLSLKQLHTLQILHRDLKPSNFLVFKEGEEIVVKLSDFGLSLPLAPAEPLTPQMVTLWYRAPEILRGEQYSLASDLWSLGCCFYELIMQSPLFTGEDEEEMLRLIRRYQDQAHFLSQRGLSKKDQKEFNLTKGGYRTFLSLLRGLLRIVPEERFTIEQVLAHPFFDEVRVSLSKYPVMIRTVPVLELHPERAEALALQASQEFSFTYHVKFLAVDLLDRFLKLQSGELEELSSSERSSTIREYGLVALILAEKYLMGERACPLEDLLTPEEVDFTRLEKLEEEFLQKLHYQIYRETPYNYLPAGTAPKTISACLFLYRQALPFIGMRVDYFAQSFLFLWERYYAPLEDDITILPA